MNTQLKTITGILSAFILTLASFSANALDFKGDGYKESDFLAFATENTGLRPASARPVGRCKAVHDKIGFASCPCTMVGDKHSNAPKQILTARHCLAVRQSKDEALIVGKDVRVVAEFPNPDYVPGKAGSEPFFEFQLEIPEPVAGKVILDAGQDLIDLDKNKRLDYVSNDPVLLNFKDSAAGNAFAERMGYMGLEGVYGGQRYKWTGDVGQLERQINAEE